MFEFGKAVSDFFRERWSARTMVMHDATGTDPVASHATEKSPSGADRATDRLTEGITDTSEKLIILARVSH